MGRRARGAGRGARGAGRWAQGVQRGARTQEAAATDTRLALQAPANTQRLGSPCPADCEMQAQGAARVARGAGRGAWLPMEYLWNTYGIGIPQVFHEYSIGIPQVFHEYSIGIP